MDASAEDVADVKKLAVEVGVNVLALGGGAVGGLEGDVAQDRCDELMKVIDLRTPWTHVLFVCLQSTISRTPSTMCYRPSG